MIGTSPRCWFVHYTAFIAFIAQRLCRQEDVHVFFFTVVFSGLVVLNVGVYWIRLDTLIELYFTQNAIRVTQSLTYLQIPLLVECASIDVTERTHKYMSHATVKLYLLHNYQTPT